MPECAAVTERRKVIEALYRATKGRYVSRADLPGFTGSQAELNDQFNILRGIVYEYNDGADQMADLCTCGDHASSDLNAAQHYELEDR